MKPIDPDKLFALFDASDEQVYHEQHTEELLENPYVLMGLVVRGMENYHMIDSMYRYRHGEQYENIALIVKRKYFLRLYKYLDRIDFEDYTHHYMVGADFAVDNVFTALNYLIKYFESTEEYERCAKIKKFIDLLYEEGLEIKK